MMYYNETKGVPLTVIGDEPEITDGADGVKVGACKVFTSANVRTISSGDVIRIANGGQVFFRCAFDKIKRGYATFKNGSRARQAVTLNALSIVSGTWAADADDKSISFETPLSQPVYSIDTIKVKGLALKGCEISYNSDGGTIRISKEIA